MPTAEIGAKTGCGLPQQLVRDQVGEPGGQPGLHGQPAGHPHPVQPVVQGGPAPVAQLLGGLGDPRAVDVHQPFAQRGTPQQPTVVVSRATAMGATTRGGPLNPPVPRAAADAADSAGWSS